MMITAYRFIWVYLNTSVLCCWPSCILLPSSIKGKPYFYLLKINEFPTAFMLFRLPFPVAVLKVLAALSGK